MYKSRDFVRILRPNVIFSKRFSSWKAKPEVPENALQVSVRGSGAARFAKKSLFGDTMRWLRSPTIDVNFDHRSWALHTGYLRNFKL